MKNLFHIHFLIPITKISFLGWTYPHRVVISSYCIWGYDLRILRTYNFISIKTIYFLINDSPCSGHIHYFERWPIYTFSLSLSPILPSLYAYRECVSVQTISALLFVLISFQVRISFLKLCLLHFEANLLPCIYSRHVWLKSHPMFIFLRLANSALDLMVRFAPFTSCMPTAACLSNPNALSSYVRIPVSYSQRRTSELRKPNAPFPISARL